MATCLTFKDLVEIGRPQVDQLIRAGDVFSSADAPGACEAFARQVRVVEGAITQTYAMAVSVTRKSEKIDEITEIWRQMGDFCTIALSALSQLKTKNPYCGASELHNLVLDYKLACERRRNDALEELECRKTELPKGVFPEMI